LEIKYPLYKPYLNGNENLYINKCISNNWISKGPFINEFESALEKYFEVNHAVTTSSGTSALHLSLIAAGIGKGDEVIVTSLTYISTINAIHYVGGIPVFIDILEDTWSINPQLIEEKISHKTKAILLVHLYGQPCEMDEIMILVQKYKLMLIEDCAQSFGAEYKSKKIGTFGSLAILSFFGNKIITTGEGGAVLTNNTDYYNKCKYYRNVCKSSDNLYWHEKVGYNYRMSNINAALGLAQLEKVEEILNKKQSIVKIYEQNLKELTIKFQKQRVYSKSSYWLFCIILNSVKQCVELEKKLERRGIETRRFFIPAYKMPMYNNSSNKLCPIAEYISKRGLCLPSYPGLSESDINYIIETIKEILK